MKICYPGFISCSIIKIISLLFYSFRSSLFLTGKTSILINLGPVPPYPWHTLCLCFLPFSCVMHLSHLTFFVLFLNTHTPNQTGKNQNVRQNQVMPSGRERDNTQDWSEAFCILRCSFPQELRYDAIKLLYNDSHMEKKEKTITETQNG